MILMLRKNKKKLCLLKSTKNLNKKRKSSLVSDIKYTVGAVQISFTTNRLAKEWLQRDGWDREVAQRKKTQSN